MWGNQIKGTKPKKASMEIHFSSLSDYLLGKKLVPGNWGVLLKDIESDLSELVRRNVTNDELVEEARVYLNKVVNEDKNYRFLNRLIDFLISSKEGEKKTLFGNYKSALINELQDIKKRYQDKNLHLTEAVKETNYILKFGISYLEKEQREIVSKIKSARKKVTELTTAKNRNVDLYTDKLSSFGLDCIIGKDGFGLNYFPRDRISDGIRHHYDLKLEKFSTELFEEIDKLLKDDYLINFYMGLIKEANSDLADDEEYILEYVIDFPTLRMFSEGQRGGSSEQELSGDEKENEYLMEDSSEEVSVSDQNYKGFEVVKESMSEVRIQLFEDRQLFGSLLMELYEILSFLKRHLVENFGLDWMAKLKLSNDDKSKTVVDYYNLTNGIIARLTEFENYEIITFRRNKYTVIEKHTEAIFAIFNSIMDQQNSIRNMETRIKEYYQELSESQQRYGDSTRKVGENMVFLQDELKNILKKEFVIKGVNT